MRIVQCHGCFDLLHLGHIRHFQAAKAHGDLLIVTITPDRYVNKGPNRPVFSEDLRREAVSALACVDAAVITNEPTAAGAIRQLRPAVFAKGPDYAPETLDPGEAAALQEVGAELVITPTEKWSSSALLHNWRWYTPDVERYLAALRARYTIQDIQGWLEKARALKALVIGDAIQDEYHYCQTLGKSGKEPMLAAQFVRAETFIGGAEAVGRHVRAVADGVGVITGPVTIKRRFIESYPFQKLFEIYEMDEAAAARAAQARQADIFTDGQAADVVIVADYGHGFITQDVLDCVGEYAKFLAVNVQANAGNHGFNTISKHDCADFISLSERELRLDARDQATDIRELMKAEAEKRHATLLITRGAHGCLAYDPDQGMVEAPAFASHTVDRMGAGDAVFGVTACLAAVGTPLDLIAFFASAVGTMAVGIVGNAKAIEREALWTQIETLLA